MRLASRLRRVALLAAVALSGACAPQPASVSGVLLDVQTEGLTGLRRATVRDEAGQTWVFAATAETRGDEGGPLNASHLRQHMASGERVTVTYRRDGDRLVALQVAH